MVLDHAAGSNPQSVAAPDVIIGYEAASRGPLRGHPWMTESCFHPCCCGGLEGFSQLFKIEAPVTHPSDRRADSARGPLVRAAAQQFAHKPYSLVNLDDVVAAVEVSRGAMYFHFPSKQALALAVIEEADKLGREAAVAVLANKLSGLETLVDLSYLTAVLDIREDWARAGLHLLGSVGRADGLEERTLREVSSALAQIARRAATEGDITQERDPDDIAHLLVSMYVGLRHTSDLDKPEQFLNDLEKAWILLLPGFANQERLRYLNRFVSRRTAVATGKVSSQGNPA